MATDADNPCLGYEQGSLDYYQALLSDYKQAWECLYVSVFRSFVPYARQRSAISTDDALDILQEGMAEFALKLKNRKFVFQGKPVAAYVFTVCRNRWISFLRKNHIQQIDTVQDVADEDQDSSTEARSSETGAIWEDNEVDWEAVSRAYAEVGEDCKTMLHCFYVEEKSLGECGARIGLQENSAKVKRFRCAQRIKVLYKQYKTT